MSEEKHNQKPSMGSRVESVLAKPIPFSRVLILLLLISAAFLFFAIARKRFLIRQQNGADLTTFVESVKRQLERVESDRVKNGDPALFNVKDFDLELTVVAKEDTKGTSGVKAEVVTADMEEQLSHELTQKVVLHMTLAAPQTVSIEESKEPIPVGGAERLPTVKLEKHK